MDINDADFDLGKLDPNALPEEIKPYYNKLLADYRLKTEEAANIRKEVEAKLAEMEKNMTTLRNSSKEFEDKNKAWETWFNSAIEDPDVWSNTLKQFGKDPVGQKDVLDDFGQADDGGIAEIKKSIEELKKTMESHQQQAQKLRNLEYQALDLRLKPENLNNPNFDIQKVIQVANEKGIGDLNLAANLAYGEEIVNKKVQEGIEAAKKEWETERENEQTKVLGSSSFPPIRVNVSDTSFDKEKAKLDIMEEVSKKYGPVF